MYINDDHGATAIVAESSLCDKIELESKLVGAAFVNQLRRLFNIKFP